MVAWVRIHSYTVRIQCLSFSKLPNRNKNSIYFKVLLAEKKEKIHVMPLEQCQAHATATINCWLIHNIHYAIYYYH